MGEGQNHIAEYNSGFQALQGNTQLGVSEGKKVGV